MYIHQVTSKRLILILGMLLFFVSSTFSQRLDAVKSIAKSKIPSSEKITQIETLISNEIENEGDSLHYLYHEYAYWLYYPYRDLIKAIEYESKAYELGKSQPIIDTVFMQKSTRDLGYYYQQNKKPRKAISLYKEAINIDNDSKIVSQIYRALAYCSGLIHDYYSGIEYYELEASLLKNGDTTPDGLLTLYHNLTDLCKKTRSNEGYKKGRKYGATADSLANLIQEHDSILLKEYITLSKFYRRSSNPENLEKAEKYKVSADSLQTRIDRLKGRLYLVKTNLAQLYNQHRYSDIEKSMSYYDQALSLAYQLEDSSRISEVYYGIGTIPERQNIDFEKSIELYEKGLSFAKKTDSLRLYLNNYGLARAYARQEDYQKSINARSMALSFLTGFNFDNPKQLLRADLIGQTEKTYLLTALTDHAETYLKYYESNQKTEHLEKSIIYFELADNVIDLLELNRTTLMSRLFWRQSSSTLYAKAIKACYLNNDIDKAFYFMEKNKALLLMEDLAQQKFKQSLNLPEVFIQEEQNLKEEILVLESLLSNSDIADQSKNDSLNKVLIDTKIALSSLTENHYGNDELLSLKPDVISLKEVQANLKSDELVLEYSISFDEGFGIYTGDDVGYLICITKESSNIIELPQLKELQEMVRHTTDFFNTPYETDNDIPLLSKVSHKLFLKLFPTKEIQELIKQYRVFIVPDSFLSTLQFEALSVRSDSLHHLIYDSEISYLYSNSFQSQLEHDKVSKPKMLAMAPGNFRDQSITSLTNSKKEVNNFKADYPGKYFLGKAATKENFLSNIRDSDIIHLATHADIRELSSPWIAFEDEKIRLEELYLTRNNASLVVLSGCNTALGKEAIGEGVMSLARGFFYSGSQTVISTLWSIDDNSTTQIVNDLYVNLRAGQRKSEALRNAKLKYLNTHSLSELSPHFWASFILLGRDDVLIESTSYTSRAYLIVFLLSIGLIFTIIYLRKRKALS